MNVLVLLETPSESLLSEVTATIGTAGDDQVNADVRTASDRGALITALGHLGDIWDALLISPVPGPDNARLGPVLAELDCFSVEVQVDNIARASLPTAGTDAQLFGMGVAGYGLALDLVAERGVR